MRNKALTKDFYTSKLGFIDIGMHDYPHYLILEKDQLEIHFFEDKNLNPENNDGQIYIRLIEIDNYYKQLVNKGVEIHPNGSIENKTWGQREFSILDPDQNLITFGEDFKN